MGAWAGWKGGGIVNCAKEIPPPKDRLIRIVANVVCSDDFSTWVDPYEGPAQWDERSAAWLDDRRMSIRMYFEAELIVLEWEEATCREFVLVGSGHLICLAARPPAFAALPEPAWHTCVGSPIDWSVWRSFSDELSRLRDSELVDLAAEHERWQRSCGSGYRSTGILTREQWYARLAAGQEVEDAIRRQIVARFTARVEKQRGAASYRRYPAKARKGARE